MSLQMLPAIAADEITVDEANALMVTWGHPLGACRRPFEQRAHALAVGGELVAATIHASTVSATCGGQARQEVVELARIARHPDHAWVLRVMLRLWRAVLVRDWHSWPVLAAVSYAMHCTPGDIYRFDGWERVGATRPSAGGGTWSNRPAVNDIDDGVKTLWRYRYALAVTS